MIISCPSCGTRYQVDEAKFPPRGRAVRCAKCSNSWHQPAPEPEASPELAVMAPEPAPVPQPPEPRPEPEPVRQRSPSIGAHYQPPQPAAGSGDGLRTYLPELQGSMLSVLAVVGGWIGLIAIVLVIAFSAVRYRQDIATIWPQSAGVYSSLGMKVNPSSIDFRNVNYHREIEDGVVVLAVTGRIVNTGQRELPVPRMVEVTLSDANNHELYHWTFGSGAATLRAGQSIPFATRLSSPPIASRHLELRFAKDGS